MRVDHRRADIPVSHQLLYRPDIITVLEQAGCEGMPEGMTCSVFWDARGSDRLFNRSLQDRPVQVVPPELPGLVIPVEPGSGEHPMPGPFP